MPMQHIIHGDCVTGMRNLPPASVDFVLTDPPYLVDYQSRDGRKVANDRNGEWLRPAFSQIYRVLNLPRFASASTAGTACTSLCPRGAMPGFARLVTSSFANATPQPHAFSVTSMKSPTCSPKATCSRQPSQSRT